MIQQVLTRTAEIQPYIDAGSDEGILWPNSTMHQGVGASNSTSGEQNLPANVDGGDGATIGSGEPYTGGIEAAIEKDS